MGKEIIKPYFNGQCEITKFYWQINDIHRKTLCRLFSCKFALENEYFHL